MLKRLAAAAFAMLIPVQAWAVLIPMDQQIDLGSGPAITASLPTVLTFEPDQGGGFTRAHLAGGDYYDAPFIDLQRAGIGLLDVTGGISISVETRYFQDPQTNRLPYSDAPVFLVLISMDSNGDMAGTRDFGLVYATQPPNNDPPFPTWTLASVDSAIDPYVDNNFDPTRVNWIYFWGTDWQGSGDDFVDFRNLRFEAGPVIPEPASLALVGLGLACAGVLRRRARK